MNAKDVEQAFKQRVKEGTGVQYMYVHMYTNPSLKTTGFYCETKTRNNNRRTIFYLYFKNIRIYLWPHLYCSSIIHCTSHLHSEHSLLQKTLVPFSHVLV